MVDEYTSNELREIAKIKNDLIIWLFDTPDKRYAIEKSLKAAFILGKASKIAKLTQDLNKEISSNEDI